ncbi:DUF4184 family protein [Streptomyces sp. MUM 2J]|nr:DUF4184 family protein [Streptomyces sp. MUM 2J]
MRPRGFQLPFTLSHAAAVLPVVRTDGTGRGRLVPAVLAAGSFAPGMTYYAAGAVSGATGPLGSPTPSRGSSPSTSSSPGRWWVCGCRCASRWWRCCRRGAGRRCCAAGPAHAGTARRGAVVDVSAALGASTRVVWDAFTHLRAVGGRACLPFWGGRWRARLCTGTCSTAVGGSPSSSWACSWRAGPPGQPVGVPALSVRDRWWAAAVVGRCAAAGAVQRASRWRAHRGAHAGPWELVPAACFGAGTGLVAGLPQYAVGVRLWRPVRREQAVVSAGAERSRPGVHRPWGRPRGPSSRRTR